eukprot:s98_g3.t1
MCVYMGDSDNVPVRLGNSCRLLLSSPRMQTLEDKSDAPVLKRWWLVLRQDVVAKDILGPLQDTRRPGAGKLRAPPHARKGSTGRLTPNPTFFGRRMLGLQRIRCRWQTVKLKHRASALSWQLCRTSAAVARSKGSLQKCTSMVLMLLTCALVAVAAVEAVRLDTASRSVEPGAINTVQKCGDMSMHVSGTSDEDEAIDETTWLDSDIVNSFGGYPIFQRQTSDGRRLQYYLGCNLTGRAVLYFDELDDDGEPVPGTFAVRQLEIGQPLRVHVGMDGEGEEAAEFSWSLLILETLVQGVVTFWDDSGIRYMDFIGAGYGSSPPLQNGSSQKTRKTKRIRSKAYAISCGRFMGDAFGLGRVRQLRSPSEADSTDSDIVRIQTGRVQKALQLDESQEEPSHTTAGRDCQHCCVEGKGDDVIAALSHRGVTLEIQGTMNRTASNKSVLKPVHQKVQVPASFYTKLGGMRIYTKQAHGQLDKVYYLRCDYTSGQPFLIMRQGGDVQVRRFNIKWWRTTSISESLGERLTLLADPTSAYTFLSPRIRLRWDLDGPCAPSVLPQAAGDRLMVSWLANAATDVQHAIEDFARYSHRKQGQVHFLTEEFARAGDLELVVLFYVPAGTWCLFLA